MSIVSVLKKSVRVLVLLLFSMQHSIGTSQITTGGTLNRMYVWQAKPLLLPHVEDMNPIFKNTPTV